MIASFVVSALLFSSVQVDAQAARFYQGFKAAWAQTKTASYVQRKTERLRSGELVVEEVAVKLRKPGDVYLAARRPQAGQEVLYTPGQDPLHLLVHKGSFPDMTLRLNIFGSLCTQNQHHVVAHSGFDYTLEVLDEALRKAAASPHGEKFVYKGRVKLRGREAHLLTLLAGTQKNRLAAALNEDTVFSFAKRHNVDPYVFFYHNPSVEEFGDTLQEGQRYVVPAYYAYRSDFVIDAKTLMLLEQSMFDRAGNLYEKYEQFAMSINPSLTDLDFSPDNPAYRF